MRSKSMNMSDEGWCTLKTTVHASVIALSCLITLPEAIESRPEVGSSRMSTEGRVTSSIPMAVRFLSPPEMPFTLPPPIRVSAQSVSFSASSVMPTASRGQSPDGGFLRAAAKASASLTVCVSQITSCCGTYATRSPLFSCGTPLMAQTPSEGFVLPETRLRNVVLPEPEGPSRAVNENGEIRPLSGALAPRMTRPLARARRFTHCREPALRPSCACRS